MIMMIATINRINPVGQKQEAASPSPKATEHFAIKQLFRCHIQLTAIIKIRRYFFCLILIIFSGKDFGSLMTVKKSGHFRCGQKSAPDLP